jgi:hypothetical protein
MKPIAGVLVFIVSVVAAHAASPALLVHEWGTFTSFQDSQGNTIPGINVDDEPVPRFVHRLGDVPVFTTRSLPARWSQGAPRCHPDVTMRLETPVVYFYPQPSFPAQQTFLVGATFVGGWLTEFYPFADAEKPGFPNALDGRNRGTLLWQQLRLGTNEERLPATREHVWVAPRAVRSAVVTEGRRQESEKYLFYRGVGHLDAPLAVHQRNGSVEVSRRGSELKSLPPLWLVRVQPDGRVQYQRADTGATSSVLIPDPDERAGNLDRLRLELRAALIGEGLFPDEAMAMLETWQLSYFESEGIRLMFILPRTWTDAHLPLSVSVDADITRVMLGRIELVSPYQRAKLHRLLSLPDDAFNLTPLYAESPIALREMSVGTSAHADLYRIAGREVPEALQLYDLLGRFRDALLAHERASTNDAAAKARLKVIMQTFSACFAVPGSS